MSLLGTSLLLDEFQSAAQEIHYKRPVFQLLLGYSRTLEGTNLLPNEQHKCQVLCNKVLYIRLVLQIYLV